MKTKSYKLSNIVKPIEYNEMQRMSKESFLRILYAKGLFIFNRYLSYYCSLDICENARVNHIHQKIISSLACLSEQSFGDSKNYIIELYFTNEINSFKRLSHCGYTSTI
jgi:hypothetical protein